MNATSVLAKGNIDEIMEREHGVVDYLLIESVGVLSAHRGRGLGGRLLRTALRAADALSVPTILYTESRENERMYERFGFRTVKVWELDAEGTPTTQMMYLMLRECTAK